MLETKPSILFLKYVIPSILGLLAISSASIVDGYFIGNYIGSTALAAINISYPLTTILFGLVLMFAVGSSVMSRKLMGEGNTKEASNIFSKSLIGVAVMSIVVCWLIYSNLSYLLHLMRVKEALQEYTLNYLPILLQFLPFLMVGIVMDYFVRVDENPMLSFSALFISSLINIILDYLFIVKLNMGISGAAYATGASQAVIILILLPHFFLKRSTLKFLVPKGSWKPVYLAMKNGISEFINESSTGITVIIFNYIMLKNFGAQGVASYTIIGYFIMINIMISFAISDALQPIIAKNYGALYFKRIKQFLFLGFSSVTIISTLLTAALLIFPESFVHLFLKSEEIQTRYITEEFIQYAWPAFIISGINILITSYLTAMQKPLFSGTIALTRSLIFPILFILILPYFFQEKGIFMALALSELLTLQLAIIFFMKTRPSTFQATS